MAFNDKAAGYGAEYGSDSLAAVGALIGQAEASGDYAEADRLRAMAAKQLELMQVPDASESALGPSALAGAQGNPQAQALRMQALQQLAEHGREGYNAGDRAAINDTLGDVQQAQRGSRLALQQRFSPNSGAGVAAQLSNAQNASQEANRRGLDIAAGSRRQALQALAEQGGLAGSINSQDFGQQLARGQATDAISKFNAQNKQQHFQNQLDLARARAGANQTAAEAADERARRKVNTDSGIGSGAGALVGGLIGGYS